MPPVIRIKARAGELVGDALRTLVSRSHTLCAVARLRSVNIHPTLRVNRLGSLSCMILKWRDLWNKHCKLLWIAILGSARQPWEVEDDRPHESPSWWWWGGFENLEMMPLPTEILCSTFRLHLLRFWLEIRVAIYQGAVYTRRWWITGWVLERSSFLGLSKLAHRPALQNLSEQEVVAEVVLLRGWKNNWVDLLMMFMQKWWTRNEHQKYYSLVLNHRLCIISAVRPEWEPYLVFFLETMVCMRLNSNQTCFVSNLKIRSCYSLCSHCGLHPWCCFMLQSAGSCYTRL